MVDICVTTALLVVMFLPGSAMAFCFDRISSAVLSVYLIWCGSKTVAEQGKKLPVKEWLLKQCVSWMCYHIVLEDVINLSVVIFCPL